MMDHIAVVLRGHIRTWNILYKDVFDFYSSLAKRVDYYFVTWALPNFDFGPAKKTFDGQNLIDFVILPKTQIWYTSWYGPAYMTYMLRPYIEQRLKKVKYDAVFETRPDVAIRLRPNGRIPYPEKDKLYVSNIEIHHSYITKKRTVALTDFWFVSDYDTFKKMSERLIVYPAQGNQVDYRLYAEKEGIGINTLTNDVETILARPNSYILKGQLQDRFAELYTLSHEWNSVLSREQKIKQCFDQNINLIDYMTTSATCKI